ncbi:hypothetical protein [Rhodococcus jostii]|uniref:hypothetical protein n=1 Tax=Rhodococcus jostii TaxID=132919 RepID=UPI00365A6538
MKTRRVPYRKLSQGVRKFEPARLLEKIALVSVELERDRLDEGEYLRRYPDGAGRDLKDDVKQWGLALVARIAIVEGENRRKRRPAGAVTDNEIRDLYNLAANLDHPDVPDVDVLNSPGFRRMMARIHYQQGLFAYDSFANITRTFGVLVRDDSSVRGLPTQQDWENVLGVSLQAYAGIVFGLGMAAKRGDGWITPETIQKAAAEGDFADIGTDAVLAVIKTHLAANPQTLRDLAAKRAIDGAPAWSFNPLMDRPLVSYGDSYLLPIWDYLSQKIMLHGLYFTGLQHFGSDFPRALGDSFENYVGEHLALLEEAGAVVHSEITYKIGKQQKKTVDYLVVFDNLVLLVETKGMRLNTSAGAGVDKGLKELVERVQGARDQIDKTAKLIADRIPELSHIPADREVRGLVVTMEPLDNIDTFLYSDMFTTNTVESATISANQLEAYCPMLATVSDVGLWVLEALTFKDPTPPALRRAVEGLEQVPNPVSDKLWERWRKKLPKALEQSYRRSSL